MSEDKEERVIIKKNFTPAEEKSIHNFKPTKEQGNFIPITDEAKPNEPPPPPPRKDR